MLKRAKSSDRLSKEIEVKKVWEVSHPDGVHPKEIEVKKVWEVSHPDGVHLTTVTARAAVEWRSGEPVEGRFVGEVDSFISGAPVEVVGDVIAALQKASEWVADQEGDLRTQWRVGLAIVGTV